MRPPILGPSTSSAARNVAEFGVFVVLGAVVGLCAAAIEWLSVELLLHWILEGSSLVQAIAPFLGLAAAALILRVGWNSSPTTSDDYPRAFHGQTNLPMPRLLPKISASIATIGSGGALGLEGPAIYLGATVGQAAAELVRRVVLVSQRALIAAGAAAGVAAVFKAPATGVLFALESPYRRDIARHALIPALVASASAYLVFVVFVGSDRLLNIEAADVALRHEVGGALLVGLVGGIAARGTSAMFKWFKHTSDRWHLRTRMPLAGLVLAFCVVGAKSIVDVPATLGPGAEMAAHIVLDSSISVWAVLGLLGLRLLATSATLAGGGVGGLFIPLVVEGLLLGRVLELMLGAPSTGLYPVIGLAAVLGAAYRTPLAAVTFVAETTGRSEFVIPALLATAVAQLMMGNTSVSEGQLDERKGHLERQLERPAGSVARTDIAVLSPEMPLIEVIDQVGLDASISALPVFDGQICQMLFLADTAAAIFEAGIDATVADAMRSIPTVRASDEAIEALSLMRRHSCDAVAVTNDDGHPVGILSEGSLAGFADLDLGDELHR